MKLKPPRIILNYVRIDKGDVVISGRDWEDARLNFDHLVIAKGSGRVHQSLAKFFKKYSPKIYVVKKVGAGDDS